jgi:hypothetical protein
MFPLFGSLAVFSATAYNAACFSSFNTHSCRADGLNNVRLPIRTRGIGTACRNRLRLRQTSYKAFLSILSRRAAASMSINGSMCSPLPKVEGGVFVSHIPRLRKGVKSGQLVEKRREVTKDFLDEKGKYLIVTTWRQKRPQTRHSDR